MSQAYCRRFAVNSEHDIAFQDIEGMLNRASHSVGELEIWKRVFSIARADQSLV